MRYVTSRRRRLDAELLRRQLVPSRAEAQRLIAEGRVTVRGAPAAKPARLVDPGDALEIQGDPPRYVSRGGEKLEAALDRFGIEVRGKRAIDVGASTGGFTDCLLQRGASEVVAIDVGRNQLHEKLKAHPAVTSFERLDVRNVNTDSIGGAAPLVVADVSFISLRLVAPDIRKLTTGDMAVLVKPQFEAGKAAADRGQGVIQDPDVWHQAILQVCSALSAVGAAIMGIMVSPIKGASGNVEFMVHADVRPDVLAIVDLNAAVASMVGEATGTS